MVASKKYLCLAALTWFGLSGFRPAQAADDGFGPETTTVYAFDDVSIPYRYHLALTMVPATKHAENPILHHGAPGSPDELRAQFYGSVIQADGKYRMWYVAMAKGRDRTATAPEQSRCWPAYAESPDGIHWTKPDLGLVDFHGSKHNNLLTFSPQPKFDQTQPLSLFILHEPREKNPTRRYKMALYGRYQATYDHSGVPFHKATIYPYFSADGYHWTLANSVSAAGVYDDQDVTFPADTIFELGGLYKFGNVYHVAGHQDIGTIQLPTGVAGNRVMVTHYSPDFVHWSKDFSLSFIRYGYRSKQDLNEAHEPAAVWNRHNVLLGLYGQWQGAARRQDARLTTSALTFPAGPEALRINVTGLAAAAQLRVDLLDAEGSPLPDYSGNLAGEVEGDGLASRVRWQNSPPPGSGAYALKFRFQGAQAAQIHFFAAYLP